MATSPRFLRQARRRGCLPWPVLLRATASERRFRLLRPALVRALVDTDMAFAPTVGQPEFLERPAAQQRHGRTSSDPLEVYWQDLRRIRPTTREEEFALARGLELLRDALLGILGRRPLRRHAAIAGEFLSPYSRVLESLRDRSFRNRETSRDVIRDERLRQRLEDLHRFQEALVARNLHLVPAAARRYTHVGVPWEDLIQEGNAALLRAVERYDQTAGVRFSHYAGWWVQQGILKALSCQSRTVRLPVYLAQALHRVRNVLASTPDTLPVPELARQARVSRERVERALAADRPCYSLDRAGWNSGPEGEDGLLAEGLADEREIPLPDAPTVDELRTTLERLLARLPEREALVLRLRFGLDGERPRTLDEVREALGVSRERVRQLQAQSLRRLAQPTPRKHLSRFL